MLLTDDISPIISILEARMESFGLALRHLAFSAAYRDHLRSNPSISLSAQRLAERLRSQAKSRTVDNLSECSRIICQQCVGPCDWHVDHAHSTPCHHPPQTSTTHRDKPASYHRQRSWGASLRVRSWRASPQSTMLVSRCLALQQTYQEDVIWTWGNSKRASPNVY